VSDFWDRESLIGTVFLLVLGWGLIALNTVRALQSEGKLFYRIVDTSIPMALALVLVVGAFGVSVYELRDQALRISGWTGLGTLAFIAAVGLNVVGIDTVDPETRLLVFMVTNAAGGGAALGLLVGVYDARQQQLKTDLQREGEKARALSQRLSVVNRVLRHDIRNQAQIIDGYAEGLLADETDVDAVARHIREANEELFETADAVRQLEPLFDGTKLECRRRDLVAIVSEVGETVRKTHDDVQIEYDLPGEQPVYVPALFDRAVRQLLANAVVHNDGETTRIQVTVRADSGAPLPVELAVEDNGPGIPEGERFADGETEETQLHHSSGLGLWFVRWIVDGAGGAVEIRTPDRSDVGTVVRVRLPLAPD